MAPPTIYQLTAYVSLMPLSKTYSNSTLSWPPFVLGNCAKLDRIQNVLAKKRLGKRVVWFNKVSGEKHEQPVRNNNPRQGAQNVSQTLETLTAYSEIGLLQTKLLHKQQETLKRAKHARRNSIGCQVHLPFHSTCAQLQACTYSELPHNIVRIRALRNTRSSTESHAGGSSHNHPAPSSR